MWAFYILGRVCGTYAECPESLQGKLLDPDEKVRAAVCKLYGQIDYETALHHVSEAQLRAVAGRGVDKKVQPIAFVYVGSRLNNSSSRLYKLRP